MDPGDVLQFWFEATAPKQHFLKDIVFDNLIRTRFGKLHARAVHAELVAWRATPAGRLAEIIVLDQFSRNLYRGDARAFAADGMALVLAQEALRVKADAAIPVARRAFLYLPFMHSESRAVHVEAERLFRLPELEQQYDYELKHKAIIDRFGRYPHRNAVLGRLPSAAEEAFLREPDSAF